MPNINNVLRPLRGAANPPPRAETNESQRPLAAPGPNPLGPSLGSNNCPRLARRYKMLFSPSKVLKMITSANK